MEKLKMQSLDVTGSNIDKIARLFPQCVTERKDKDGKTVLGIDFGKLRDELSADVIDDGEECYQFTWPDKKVHAHLANTPTTKTLRPCREESVDFDHTQNLYIEGDNLDVLKVIRETYLGKVKMIYIDPPYNTGNDFVYNDDFAQNADDYQENSGQLDEEGNRLVQNTESNGRFHTDWLNMIYPRLKVAKDLLSNDGVIFISIDDNEQANLKKICDEAFGGDNFVAQMIWEQGRKSAGKTIAINHEYCLIYCKSLFSVLQLVNLGKQLWKTKKKGLDILYNKEFELRRKYGNDLISINKEYKSFLSQLPENSPAYMHKHYKCIDEKGIYFPADASAPDSPETRCHKALIHPITKKECKVPRLGWRYNETTLMQLYNNSLLHFGVDETVIPCIKRYLKDTEYEVASSVFYKDGRGASNRLAKLMGKKVFDFPKDEFIIEDFIKLVSTDDKDDIILDFFSGSATTAHAVMQLNAEDGGNRKFIMVQLPEKTDEKSEAYKAGYKNICEIGKERIRRAGKKIKEDLLMECEKKTSLSLTRYALGTDNDKPREQWKHLFSEEEREAVAKEVDKISEKIEKLDIGFRVLKLDSSNMQDVYYTPKDFTSNDLFADNVKPDRTAEDLLFQVMLDLGVELSATIEQRTMDSKTVFFVNDNYLVACFDTDIAEDTIKAIAKLKPYYFVMRDSSLASDNVADNFDQLFETYSKDTIRKII